MNFNFCSGIVFFICLGNFALANEASANGTARVVEDIRVDTKEDSNFLQITWNPIEDANGYTVKINQLTFRISQANYIFKDVIPKTKYSISVKPNVENGTFSRPITVTSGEARVVEDLRVDTKEDSNFLYITWKPIEDATGYTVEINQRTTEVAPPHYIFKDVIPKEKYSISVKPNVENGTYSELITVTGGEAKVYNVNIYRKLINQRVEYQIEWSFQEMLENRVTFECSIIDKKTEEIIKTIKRMTKMVMYFTPKNPGSYEFRIMAIINGIASSPFIKKFDVTGSKEVNDLVHQTGKLRHNVVFTWKKSDFLWLKPKEYTQNVSAHVVVIKGEDKQYKKVLGIYNDEGEGEYRLNNINKDSYLTIQIQEIYPDGSKGNWSKPLTFKVAHGGTHVDKVDFNLTATPKGINISLPRMTDDTALYSVEWDTSLNDDQVTHRLFTDRQEHILLRDVNPCKIHLIKVKRISKDDIHGQETSKSIRAKPFKIPAPKNLGVSSYTEDSITLSWEKSDRFLTLCDFHHKVEVNNRYTLISDGNDTAVVTLNDGLNVFRVAATIDGITGHYTPELHFYKPRSDGDKEN